jgi:hypothetical protein
VKNFLNRQTVSPLLIIALAGAAFPAVASADAFSPTTFTNKPSYKLLSNGSNATATIPFGAGGNAYKVHITGTLHRNTPGSYPSEACIRFQALTHLSQQVSVVTHEFIAQPFTTTQWDANGNATVDEAIVLPAPENLNFNNHFSSVFMSSPGHYDLTFFEQFDDNAADNGPTPDATWTSLTVTFDDEQPSLATAAPLTGTVGTTTRYGVRSDDTLDPGQFTGGMITNLQQPANATRIKHVRITGWLSANAFSTPTYTVGNNQTGQARLRLVRHEAVLLSPNDLQPFTSTEELFVTVPAASASSQYVSLDIPVASNDSFGKLTRNVPMGGENSSYYGIDYYVNCYEDNDDPEFSPDSIWNGLKIEMFSDAQPPECTDLGMLHATPNGVETHRIAPGTIPVGKPLWYRFELPGEVSNAAGTFLDIDTEATVPSTFDTMIGLYGGESNNAGVRIAYDDDDASDHLSQLTFGQVGPRPGFGGNSQPRNGRDGSLAAGVYYVAVAPYVSGVGTNALGATEFNVTNTDTVSHSVTLNLRYNLPLGCGAADVGGQGGVAGADGVLDNNDFVVFIDYFFNHNAAADRGIQGGLPGTDGQWDNNDFVVFIDQFFAGC